MVNRYSKNQNILTGYTAAELIYERTNVDKPHMGLTTWAASPLTFSAYLICVSTFLSPCWYDKIVTEILSYQQGGNYVKNCE